jgi:hypothetical protein
LAQTSLAPALPPAQDGSRRSSDIRLIDKARLPDGGELLLLQSGDAFSIELDEEELMGNTDYVSEQDLAHMTAQRLGRPDGAVLIGGLGMGFTLGAALEAWGQRRGFAWPNWCLKSSPGHAGRWPMSWPASWMIRA